MPRWKITSIISKQLEETELIIDTNDIMVKHYVAGKWDKSSLFTGFSYESGIKLDGVIAFQKGKIPIEAKLNSSGHKIDVIFARPFQKNENYAYELQMLVNPDEFIQKIGKLNIIEWPKQSLSRIVFLKNAGEIFFSSALAKIKYHPQDQSREIVPGDFSRSITSHSRKSSAIRIEWGFAPIYNLTLTYQINNRSDLPIENLKIQSYLPPSTKFQKVDYSELELVKYMKDEDENCISTIFIEHLSPFESITIPISIKIRKIGNSGVMLPNFGTWKEYASITTPNSIGAAMILSSKYWNLTDPNIQDLVQVLKRNAVNVSQYIKLAFEFVNQRVQYQMNGIRDTAANVLQTRQGDCSEMSDLFVSLLRGGGIPAKIVHGWVLDPVTYELNPHAWSEFFSPRVGGWRQCDPTWGYLTGVSCQHITRQREGLIKDQHTFSWMYKGDAKIEISETTKLSVIS